jgi:hypothetical protein
LGFVALSCRIRCQRHMDHHKVTKNLST